MEQKRGKKKSCYYYSDGCTWVYHIFQAIPIHRLLMLFSPSSQPVETYDYWNVDTKWVLCDSVKDTRTHNILLLPIRQRWPHTELRFFVAEIWFFSCFSISLSPSFSLSHLNNDRKKNFLYGCNLKWITYIKETIQVFKSWFSLNRTIYKLLKSMLTKKTMSMRTWIYPQAMQSKKRCSKNKSGKR